MGTRRDAAREGETDQESLYPGDAGIAPKLAVRGSAPGELAALHASRIDARYGHRAARGLVIGIVAAAPVWAVVIWLIR